MAKKKHKFKELDIVILADGRVFQVSEEKSDNGSMLIRWLESDTETFLFDSEKIYVKDIIPYNPLAHFLFIAARSIHQRLNNLNKV
jgi:hypothetical protein